MAALPMSSYAAMEETVTVQVSVNSALTITGADGNSGTSPVGYTHNYDVTAATPTLTHNNSSSAYSVGVISNAAFGYTLSLADADDDTDLNRTGGGTGIPTKSVEPVSGDPGWAVAVSTTPTATSSTGSVGSWQAMPTASGNPINIGVTTGAQTNPVDYYRYAFATSISMTTQAGDYSDQVRFTLVANEDPEA
jgi:hypothetical protein